MQLFDVRRRQPAGSGPVTARVGTIDIIRGYCIASMISSHLSGGSLLGRALHVFPAFDGASGFVLLSGLILGIVQSRRLARGGLAPIQRKTVSRLGVILVAQLALIVLGLVVAIFLPHPGIPDTRALSWGEIVTGTLGLYLAPPAASVLRLYVGLLALAMLAYWLLARDRWRTLLVVSAALYAVGFAIPGVTSFRRFDTDALGANIATWQLVFVLALVIGWKWRSWRIAERLGERAVWVALGSVAVLIAARFGERIAPPLFDKVSFAPGRVVAAFAVVALLYVCIEWVLRVVPRILFRPIEIVGTRSLDSYIIQAAVAIMIPAGIFYDKHGVAGMAVVVATFLACWAWAEFRRSRWWPPRVIEARSGGVRQRLAYSS